VPACLLPDHCICRYNVLKSTERIFSKHTSWDTVERFRFRGQKVKVQGHGGIKCAGNSTSRTKANRIRRLVTRSEFLLTQWSVCLNLKIRSKDVSFKHGFRGSFTCLLTYLYTYLRIEVTLQQVFHARMIVVIPQPTAGVCIPGWVLRACVLAWCVHVCVRFWRYTAGVPRSRAHLCPVHTAHAVSASAVWT